MPPQVLKDCPNLEFLSINDNKFKEVNLSFISSPPFHHQLLHFGHNYNHTLAQVAALEPLKALTKLTHLDIQVTFQIVPAIPT